MKEKISIKYLFLDKLAQGLVFSLITLFVGRTLGFIITFLLAKLGTKDFGLYNLSFSIFSTISTLALLGFSIGMTRYISFFLGQGKKQEIKNVVLTGLIIIIPFSLLLAFLIYLFAEQIAFLFKEEHLALYLKLFAIAIPLSALINLTKSTLNGFLRIKRLFWVENLESFMGLILVAFFLFLGWRLSGAILGQVMAIFLTSLLAFYFLLNTVLFKNARFVFFKELVSFSWPISLSEILRTLALGADLWILGFFKNASTVGIYSLGFALASLMLILPQILLQFFSPIISRLYGRGKKINEIYQILTYWLFAIIFPVFLFIIFNGQRIITLFFGSEYVLSWGVLFFLSLSQLVFGLFIFGGRQVLDVLKLTRYNLFLTILRVSILFLFFFLLIPKWGMMGAALALFLSFAVEAIFCLTKIFQETKAFFLNRRYLVTVILALLPCFIFIPFPWFGSFNHFFRLFLNLFLYFLIYALLNIKLNLYNFDKIFLKTFLANIKVRRKK